MATYTLKKAVKHGDVEYKELSFREATVGDLMVADQFTGDTSKTIAILASISDVPLPAFKQISMTELNEILKVTKDILGESL